MNCQWATSHLCKQHTPFGLYLVVFPFAYLILRCFHLMALLSIMPYLKGRCWMARFTVFSSLRFLFSCCIQTDPALVTAVLTPPLCHLPWGAVLMVNFFVPKIELNSFYLMSFHDHYFRFKCAMGAYLLFFWSSFPLTSLNAHYNGSCRKWSRKKKLGNQRERERRETRNETMKTSRDNTTHNIF